MGRPINIGRALAFNGLTTSLAAVSFAYTEAKFGGRGDSAARIGYVVVMAVFAYSFVMGLLVAGKAADFPEAVTDTDDEALKALGRRHTFALLAGLGAVALGFVAQEFGLLPAAGGTCTSEIRLETATLAIAHDCTAVEVR